MKVLDNNGNLLTCGISHEEMLILMAGMREICFGVDIHAFDTRIGFSKERLGALVKTLEIFLMSKA
jgi:hypothetical protein